ncbi:LysM peptidoglycan-binding domain-containing protein [Fulvivirga ulvae]|uniref:LysM peptidoglycan-binding domain-containing protein n=1 Tax=Fulvivirga ulvae TaxID=2904245 RepID=UPI001F2A6B7E|nr:LysM peptidoglycan-binding domain-containing protein [Fulvivirga ulvae]UII32635.1 LysM peptidoglycan-binding domain-containing protein [Fulvivirga ulvae]
MKFFLSALIFISSLQVAASTIPADSVGLETKGGKTYILHRVEEKETLYSLSRRYNVPINQIVENNPPSEYGLEIGQIIRVPLLERKPKKRDKTEVTQVKDNGVGNYNNPQKTGEAEKVHVVKPKETMFSISRMYSVSIEDIRKWNNIDGNILDIGQKLIIRNNLGTRTAGDNMVVKPEKQGDTHIVRSGETLYSISKSFNVTVDDLKGWNDLIDNDISIGQELFVSRPAVTIPANNKALVLQEPVSKEAVGADIGDKPETTAIPTNGNDKDSNKENTKVDVTTPVNSGPEKSTGTFAEVSESGLAELIEGSENTRKYLALHRTAKIGTIMKVRNEMNDQEVFVRVLGRLPDTGVNQNVLIKISKSAYDRLGAIDAKFRVSVSYIP